ncbi:hypothetical protein ES707_11883 [subsurface metagenome]
MKQDDITLVAGDNSLNVAMPPIVAYAGTITEKELKYQLSLFEWTDLLPIPVSGIPKGSKVRLHITGKNDTDSYQSLKIHWLVYDPDGAIIRNYEDWSHHHCPGCDHMFVTPVGKEFPLNKLGPYTIKVALSMNPDDPVEVAWYEGVLCTVVEAPPPPPPTSDIRDFDFKAESGTYDLGDSVSFDAPYEYKGKAQSGWLTISLGTGIYPAFFTKHTFPRIRVYFDEAMDWTSDELTGSFTLPTTLEAGQTYSTRAKLETDDGKQETDTDWGVITIEEEAPPPVEYTLTGEESPAVGWISGLGDYDSGKTATITARLDSWAIGSYEFDHWGGDASGTSPTTTVTMNRDKHVIAYFKALAGVYTLTVRQSPAVGWITKDPDKAKYAYGEIVKVTTYMDSWAIGTYALNYWDCDGEWVGTAASFNFMVLASHTLTANYRKL